MSDPDDDAVDGVQQRVVSAADGSPLHTAAASSVFNWRGDGAAAPATLHPTSEDLEVPPRTSPPPEEEETMVTKRKGAARARKSSGGSPQLQICTLLMHKNAALTRDAIAESLPELTAQQIASALNNAKAKGRIAWIEKDSAFRLTKAGLEWVSAAAAPAQEGDAPRANGKRAKAARKTAHRRGRKAKAENLDTSPPAGEAAEEPTFRCAVMSDGSFFLSKDTQAIELDPDEHRQMLRYLERMAVDVDA